MQTVQFQGAAFVRFAVVRSWGRSRRGRGQRWADLRQAATAPGDGGPLLGLGLLFNVWSRGDGQPVRASACSALPVHRGPGGGPSGLAASVRRSRPAGGGDPFRRGPLAILASWAAWASWGRWNCPARAADLGAGDGSGRFFLRAVVRLSSLGGTDPGDGPGLRAADLGGGPAAELGGSAPGLVPWSLGGDPGRPGCGRLRGRIFQGRGALYSPAKFSRIYSPAHFPGHSRQIRFSRGATFTFSEFFRGRGGKLPFAFFRQFVIIPSLFAQNLQK